MPTELKQLSDYYDPMRTGVQAMQVLQGQQHLALQQQQQELTQQQQGLTQHQMAAQQKNLLVDNLQKALDTADPMQSYPIYKQRNDLLGLPVQPVNEYYANLPSQKIIEGSRELNKQGGIGDSTNLAYLTANKPAIQTQIANAVAQSPLQQEQLRAIQNKNIEHEAVVAEIQPEIKALNGYTQGIILGVKMHAPNVEKWQGLTEQYERMRQSQGMTAAGKARNEALQADPELQKFQTEMKAAIPKTQEALMKVGQDQAALATRLRNLADGVDTLREGESVELLTGQARALAHQAQFIETSLAFQKNPTAGNLQAIHDLGMSFEDRITALREKKNASQESLDIRRSALAETVSEHQLTRKRVDNVGKAQVAWMESGGDMSTAHKYAKQFGVNVNEVTEAAKDPNKPLVKVDNFDRKQSITEAGKLANINQSISEIQQARRTYIKPDGSVDRVALFTGAIGLPGSEGRTADINIQKATEVKLRAATGAEAKKDEVKKYARLFAPSQLDSDELVKYKLDSFENWMQTVADTTDPEGSLRKRSEELLGKGTIQLLQTDDYKYLRDKYPRASASDIVQAVQRLHAQEKQK